MGASHLVKTKRTLTDELPTGALQDNVMFQLVFNTEKIVAWCSKLFTLLPGDLILTGTPPGVGVFMKPPEFLKASSRGNRIVI